MAFWQVKEEAAGGDVAMVAADVIEPDEREGEGVEAGVAVWRGQGGDGLLATDQQGGREDGREGVFELGFAAEGFPAPVAVMAVEEESELLCEGGAFGQIGRASCRERVCSTV